MPTSNSSIFIALAKFLATKKKKKKKLFAEFCVCAAPFFILFSTGFNDLTRPGPKLRWGCCPTGCLDRFLWHSLALGVNAV